jgi:hypothetical protein
MKRTLIAIALLAMALTLTAANSPSHTLASSNAEKFSTDTTVYSSIAIFNRATNGHNMQVGGPEITASAGGVTIAPNSGYLFQSTGGNRLSDIFVAGTSGEVADSIVYATRP